MKAESARAWTKASCQFELLRMMALADARPRDAAGAGGAAPHDGLWIASLAATEVNAQVVVGPVASEV